MTITINPATILTDIRRALDKYERLSVVLPNDELHAASRPYNQLVKAASSAFGTLNGWSNDGPHKVFRLSDIGKERSSVRQSAFVGSELLSDCVWYQAAGKYAAIVAQPNLWSLGGSIKTAKEVADLYELVLHIPPNRLASIHSPGKANFYVFTQPEHQITWLPEQVGSYSDPTLFKPASTEAPPRRQK